MGSYAGAAPYARETETIPPPQATVFQRRPTPRSLWKKGHTKTWKTTKIQKKTQRWALPSTYWRYIRGRPEASSFDPKQFKNMMDISNTLIRISRRRWEARNGQHAVLELSEILKENAKILRQGSTFRFLRSYQWCYRCLERNLRKFNDSKRS